MIRHADPDGWSTWRLDDLAETDEAGRRHAPDPELVAELEEEAYRRGVREGADQVRAQARKELSDALEAAHSVVAEIHANQDAWSDALRERLVVLAAGIAAVVFEEAREQDPDLFVRLAEQAVASFPADEDLRIRLHPDDLALLEENGGPADRVVGGRSAHWVPDEDIVRGGCIVEGPDRIVDGRVDEALRRVVQELTHD